MLKTITNSFKLRLLSLAALLFCAVGNMQAQDVAKIGDTVYASLAEAIAAVPTDGTETTITMIADEAVVAGVTIVTGKNIVLELNGKTISGNTDSSKTYALITNKGTLTIQDNTDTNADGTGTGLITTYIANPDGGDVPGYASNTITNNGSLTVKSGKIVNNGSGYACYAIDTQTNGTAFTPTLKIEGGRMQQMNAYTYAVRMFCNSTTNMNSVEVSGGVIEGGYGLWVQTPNNKANKANLTITGGVFNANDGAALYVGGTKADNSNISINIDGGQINGTGVIIQGPLSGTYGEVAITDGEIVEVKCGANVENFISGGTYSEAPDTKYIAEGYVAAKKGNVYVVIPASELPVSPIIFHDEGKYEGAIDVAIAGEGTIKYALTDGTEQTYSAPIQVNETTTVTAWTVTNGIESDKVSKTFTIVPAETSDINLDDYYTIQTNDGKYMNVAGRKTVTLNSDTKSAGTVLKVKAENGVVKELRSQAVDLPRYAERAMSYVPDLVNALMARLGENDVIGEQGADLIATEFTDKFDYHLYLEEAAGGYRIYGKTPSMSLVVDFYAKNKELIDSRLPKVEGFVEDILLKVADRLGHPGSDWAKKFKIHNLWTALGGEASGLTEPVEEDEAAIGQFYTEVLSSEKNIWNFAHETMMIYWDKVESYLNGNEQSDININLGDYSKYISRIKNIQPDFKYYIVPDASGVDIISEGNEAIINNAPTAVWTLTKREDFSVTFNEENTLSGKYYTTFYADFAYTLPTGVKAYTITDINETTGVAKRQEITGTIPAQTPVLLESESIGDIALALTTETGTAVGDNLLVGPDGLINKYEINSSQVEDLLNMLKELSESLYNDYEYLQRKNAGTVNNKYFFGLDEDDLNLCTYKNEDDEDDCVVRNLGTGDEKLGFYTSWEVNANKAFIVSETFNPVKLFLKGDVNRDGKITIADVTALVNIILGKATRENDSDKYDFDAAYVNNDDSITIADVTALVNIILDK